MKNSFSVANNKKVIYLSQKQVRNMQVMTVLVAFLYMSLFVYQNVYGIPSPRSAANQVHRETRV